MPTLNWIGNEGWVYNDNFNSQLQIDQRFQQLMANLRQHGFE